MRVMKAALPAFHDEVCARQRGRGGGVRKEHPALSSIQGEEQLRGNRAVMASPVGGVVEGGGTDPTHSWSPSRHAPAPRHACSHVGAQGHTCLLTSPKETKQGNHSFKNEMMAF